MSEFKIENIDHVAIMASNPEESIKWYTEVIGLNEIRAQAWGDFPVFMVSGETGVAIFPAAKKTFKTSNIPFQFKDHTYFHSMYLKDPDNHTVELTTLLVDPKHFYKL